MRYSTTTYRIYDFMKSHIGVQNSVSARTLAMIFFSDKEVESGKRAVREAIRTIRTSPVFDNVIVSCDSGYYWATEDERGKVTERQEKLRNNLSRTIAIVSKKAEMNGQELLQITPDTREVYNSLAEVK